MLECHEAPSRVRILPGLVPGARHIVVAVLASECIAFGAALAQAGPAPLALAVDAREAPRRILHVRETVPVRPGPLVLRYARWIPGEHGPTGPVVDVAGLTITAQSRPLAWRRDLEDMYAIRTTVPEGQTSIEIAFDFLPAGQGAFSSGASTTPALVDLNWNQVVMYPSAPRPGDLVVAPSVTLPEGWRYATALRAQPGPGAAIRFAPVSLTDLVDSPLIAGAFLRSIDLTPPSGVPHTLNLVADDDAALAITPERVQGYRNLIVEANALFGAHHYDHYDFLFTLSDRVAQFGLEHHQSSDDRLGLRAVTDPGLRLTLSGWLLPHEYVHSWNGKHRRPAGLATGDFTTPMHTDLLWVYEGLTEYLGMVLTARSGIWSADEFRQDLARVAGMLDNRRGRAWRPLQDASDEAQLLYFSRSDGLDWRRGTDFYEEGTLIWLDADVTIRRLTHGQRSLDDFCRAFFGGASDGPTLLPYTYADLVRALDGIAAYDWDGFFRTRVREVAPRAPLGGIEQGGWRLAYQAEPTAVEAAVNAWNPTTNFVFDLGFLAGPDGTLMDVLPSSPAATAGLAPGVRILAVDGQAYSTALLTEALGRGVTSSAPLQLLTVDGTLHRTYALDYHGGSRHPVLLRDTSQTDILSRIVEPLAARR